MGKAWLEENKPILNDLAAHKKLKIVMWKELVKKSSQVEQKSEPLCTNPTSRGHQYYDEDDEFRKMVDAYSKEYGQKYQNDLEAKNIIVPFEICRLAAKNYYLEESNIIFVLPLLDLDFDLMTYPGKVNEGISYLYTKDQGKSFPFLEYRLVSGRTRDNFFNASEERTDEAKQEPNTHSSLEFK
jgi:hypothetical protein